MAAFEDNNPFASPSSPASSRANSYAPFGNYAFSSPQSQSYPTMNPGNIGSPSSPFENSNRPQTSSSEDAPAYQYRATNSDLSVETPAGAEASTAPTSAFMSREKEGESCCKIDDILCKNPEMRIIITDAGKASDGGAHFIAYTIEVGVPTLQKNVWRWSCREWP